MESVKLLYIDLFCGAGGTSTGIESARIHGQKCARVVACVNHDPNAIASHLANHPDVVHYTEDIRTLDLAPMVSHLKKCCQKYPLAHVVLWASLECTNFSRAKGGMPRDADSRTLAEHLFRYIEAIQPDYIQIENVEEFMCWGDLDDRGKPVSRDRGRCYVKWTKDVCRYGYTYDYRILNSADYGSYTSRKRFFGMFARKGLPICWPVPEYCKGGGTDLFSAKKWKPVREVLDLEDEGESIFGRTKPLVEKTLERIYAGLIKFVAGGKDAYLIKYNSMNQGGKYVAPGIDEPCPTVACQNRLGIVKVCFLSKQFSGDPAGKNISIDQPAGAVTCKDHHAFITAYYTSVQNTSVDAPSPTVTTHDHLGIVKVKQWLMDTSFGNVGVDIDRPAPVITANRKWHYLMTPQFASPGSSIDSPCFTLIARMDKRPPILVMAEQGIGIAVYEEDSPMTVRIKEFMAMYGISDIKMRMLNIGELKRIMGFPTDYVLKGTQAEQKKYIGNAVEVHMGRALCERLCQALN